MVNPSAPASSAQTSTPSQATPEEKDLNPFSELTRSVASGVTEAASKVAADHPDRNVQINIRDINVIVVGFDDFVDATRNYAPPPIPSPAPGRPAQPGTPVQGQPSSDGGSEQIARKIEIRKGDIVIRATEDLSPAPAQKAPVKSVHTPARGAK